MLIDKLREHIQASAGHTQNFAGLYAVQIGVMMRP